MSWGFAFRIRQFLKGSLWVVPLCAAIAGPLLGVLDHWVDRLQKLVLATFVGTLTFSFWLLRHVEQSTVPDIGVTVAGFAAAASLVLLLLYINRFTHALRPVAVAAAVAREGRKVVDAAPTAT